MAIRLIDTTTLCLTYFLGNIPRYAVLSHTWGADEISFQDMMAIGTSDSPAVAETFGYHKIVGACRLARGRGIGYVWVDTCCIDKTSSSELSEAINSMYRWYWDAEVCFALLPDFDPDLLSREVALSQCRWFTRGWCLQELIAPETVELYDGGWNRIGVKAEMTTLLSRITRIDERVLLDREAIASVPLGRRMSWAAARKTTRQEDTAYCLLGIFGVNMPMLYGEGSRAFLRLQEEIIKSTNDLSLFACDPYSLMGPRDEDEDETDEEAPTQRARDNDTPPEGSYCDLFARSPEAFAGCGALAGTGSNFRWNDAFSLTNRGLHFPRVKLRIEPSRGCYLLPLNCTLPGKSRRSAAVPQMMLLRKVGPHLFVKYFETAQKQGTDDDVFPEAQDVEIEEVYIITDFWSSSHTLQGRLVFADQYAIRIISNQGYQLSKTLQAFQRVPSSSRWDVARSQLLTSGESHIQGFWKLFPNLARPIVGAAQGFVPGNLKRATPCLLICGIGPSGKSSTPRAWVRLCSLSEWKLLEAEFGISITNGNDYASPLDTGKTMDHITVNTASGDPPLLVTARIRLEQVKVPRYFTLEIAFDGPRTDGTQS